MKMSIEESQNCQNNNCSEEITKRTGVIDMNINGNKINEQGDKAIKNNIPTPNNVSANEGKLRLISSSDSGQGTTSNEHLEDKSANSQHSTSGCQSNGENADSPGRSRSTSCEDSEVVQQKLRDANSKFNKTDVDALLATGASYEKPPSQTSDSDNRSRTLSWVKSCNGDGHQFSNHLDVKSYYSATRGYQFVEEVLSSMCKTDRYRRRVNYDPDQPAAGTEFDMEYKFYLDKMCVKKLIGSHGENSEMIRAVNQVDFYVSKNQDENIETEIVTVRGPWANVRQTIIDIRDMMMSVGKQIDIRNINTAVDLNEFLLLNSETNYARLPLHTLEPIRVTGTKDTVVLFQNQGDFRLQYLEEMDTKLNKVYGTPDGWKGIVPSPVETVPLPVNEFNILVAPDMKGRFYRGIVEQTKVETGEADIWFLDWGGRCTVPMSQLYKLHNSFNVLPYFGLVGNLAGCLLEHEDPNFGPMLLDLIRRHMPVTAKAVYMDADGHYSILLYGNGGECINHILIKEKLVKSYAYVCYEPFTEGRYVHMEYFNPETEKIETFVEWYSHYYPEYCDYQQDYYYTNYDNPGFYRKQKYKDEYRRNYRGGGQGRFKFYRDKRGAPYMEDQGYEKPNRRSVPETFNNKNSGMKNNENGYVHNQYQAKRTTEKSNPTVGKSTSTNTPVNGTVKNKPASYMKSGAKTNSKATTPGSFHQTGATVTASDVQTTDLTGNKSGNPLSVEDNSNKNDTENPSTCSPQSKDETSPNSNNVWTSKNVSKSSILRPKPSPKETQSVKPRSPNTSNATASCDSCVSSPTNQSLSSEHVKVPGATANRAVVSSTSESTPNSRNFETEWTVVNSKKRHNRRKGRRM